MTLEQLNELFALREQLRKVQEMRQSFMDAARPGAQVLTGMPHSQEVRDKVGDLAVEIADLSSEVDRIQTAIAKKEPEIRSFIFSVPDYYVRTVFQLRYLRGLTWKETAVVLGGKNTVYGVKSACYQYLKKVASSTHALPHRNA